MIAAWLPLLLSITAIATALTAGVFYAFSSFVMAGLGRIPAEQAAAAMNAINVTVITPSFMILFLGTGLLCAILGVWSAMSLGEARAGLVLAGSLLYLVGCIGVTMVFNLPLNDRLAAEAATWPDYQRIWIGWNHLRTAAPIGSAGLFIAALLRG